MRKDVKVEFLKEKNLDACIELIKEKGKFKEEEEEEEE